MMQKAMKDAAAANPNPQATVMIQQLSTPNGMVTILILAAILFFFAAVACFATICPLILS